MWIFVVKQHGRLRPHRRQVGLALVGVRGYFIITRLTRSWYLILVGSLTLYALTATWDKIWATDVVVSAEALFDISD